MMFMLSFNCSIDADTDGGAMTDSDSAQPNCMDSDKGEWKRATWLRLFRDVANQQLPDNNFAE